MKRDAELERKLDALAKKRDYAADVLNKPMLAWTYQKEIDELVESIDSPAPLPEPLPAK